MSDNPLDSSTSLPIPQSPEEQKNFIEIYTKVLRVLLTFDSKLEDIDEKAEPLTHLTAIFTEVLQEAGIKLTDVNSLLGTQLHGIKKDNKAWETGSSKILDSLKGVSGKLWAVIAALTISIGIGIFDKMEQPDIKGVSTVEKHFYHLPDQSTWEYDGYMLWTIVDGDTIYKKP